MPQRSRPAGVTMATAMLSLLTGKPVHRKIAMTGEITLRGEVLPVGGIKEKVLAAHRAKIRTVILPAEVDASSADARLEGGVLTLTLAKKVPAGAVQIQVA